MTEPAAAAPQPRIIATFSTYNGTVMAFRELLAARGVAVNGESVSEVTGLTVSYIGKLLGPSQARRIGWDSLFALCGAGGACLALVVDEDALRKYSRRIEVRNDAQVRVLAVRVGHGKQRLQSVRLLREIAHKGGEERAKKLSPRRRRQIARNAAAVRWDAVKAAVKAESIAQRDKVT